MDILPLGCTPQTLLRWVVGALGFALLAWGVQIRSVTSDWEYPKPQRFASPGLEIQLAATVGEIQALFPPALRDRRLDEIRRSVRMDYLFIILYVMFLSVFAWWSMGTAPGGLAVVLALAAIACVLVAAASDVVENNRILDTLSSLWGPAATANSTIRLASITKWAFLFASLLLIAGTLFLRPTLLNLVLAVAFALSGLLGLIGLLSSDKALEASTLPWVTGILLAIVALPFVAGEP